MESVYKSKSLSLICDSLSELTLDSRFTRLKLGHLGIQHMVAEVDGPGLGCTDSTKVMPHSSALANGSLESISAIEVFCPR